ncbi:Sapep family Mn(2+)-dependent dipeptidase [Mycoplasma marinum]|uniref:Peptidase M20 dimerisation domain-containing protein n=1 Tax=Mycoplasma marinum TaxID=1937190 RepID=A0A4R0XMF7_9MOLU|nr:Sapep family Mn(2+)-dependent dipeptidase [Mycoplasma marinum]TCG11717.1 hypothetical protein C4B24_01015 [Mycoplasma marinum]
MEKQIKQKLEFYNDEMKKSLKELVKINSTRDYKTAGKNKPFGDGVKSAMEYMINKSKKEGMLVKEYEGYALDIRTKKSDDDYIGVICHIDTVPANPEKWIQNPWDPLEKDGFIYGRGTQDDKGPLIAVYYALKVIKDLKIKLAKPIRLIIGGSEETNYEGIKKYFSLNKQPLAAFTADNAFPGINNEKGGAKGKLTLNFDSEIIKKFNGGKTINIVPDYAEAEITLDLMEVSTPFFEFLEKNKLEGSVDSQGENTLISIKGIPAHGSTPKKGVNAVLFLAKFLYELTNDNVMKIITENFFNETDGTKIGINPKTLEFGDVSINASIAKMVENNFELQMDIRFPYGMTSSEIEEKVSEHFCCFDFNIINANEPLYYAPDSKIVSTLYSTYQELTGDYKSELITSGGGTYAKVTNNCIAFGGLFPGSEWRMHAIDERVKWDEIVKQAEIYIHALIKMGNQEW